MVKSQASERTAELTRIWSDGRNEGIREGLMMAIRSITDRGLPWEVEAEQAIIKRGDKHFGDSSWRHSQSTSTVPDGHAPSEVSSTAQPATDGDG